MPTILSSPGSMPSAQLLRDRLQAMIGPSPKIWVSSQPQKLSRAPIVRYGNSGGVFSSGETGMNSPEFIRLVSNKLLFSNLLLEHNLLAPHFQHLGEGTASFPYIIRDTLTGSGGRGIHLIQRQVDYDPFRGNRNCYWTAWQPTQNEYRIHVVGGEIARVFRKMREDGQPEETYPIRNLDRGYRFVLTSETNHASGFVHLVEQIHTLLPEGASFYTLDVGTFNAERGTNYFTFEANSAPGLNEHSADAYARFIAGRMGWNIANTRPEVLNCIW